MKIFEFNFEDLRTYPVKILEPILWRSRRLLYDNLIIPMQIYFGHLGPELQWLLKVKGSLKGTY